MKRKLIYYAVLITLALELFMFPDRVSAASGDVAINSTNFPDSTFRGIVSNLVDLDDNGVLSQSERDRVQAFYGSTYGPLDEQDITSLKGIEYFTNLKQLSVHGNQLTSLDVSKNTALTWLSCDDNKLTALDVSKNPLLEKLSCYDNQLTTLNISNNTALTFLDCSGNTGLKSLDVSKNVSLESLNCSEIRQLKTLDVSQNTALRFLYCGSNQLSSLNVKQNQNLVYLDCSTNQLTSLDISANVQLSKLYCNGNSLTSLNVSKNTALSDLRCFDNTQLASLTIGSNANLTSLRCFTGKLTSLDLSGCPALTYLDCYGNNLTTLDVSQNTALTTLYCYYNQLTSLNLTSNRALQKMECYQNKISSLDIGKCPNLKNAYENGTVEELTLSGKAYLRYTISGSGYLFSVDKATSVITVQNQYTVSYDANGGTGAPASQTKDENVALTLSSTKPTKKYVIRYNANGGSISPASKNVNCVFRNWNTSQNGSGTAYSPGGRYTANANVTLYAQWQNPTAGELDTPERSGYSFAGWYTSASGGTRFTSSSTVTGNITVYAHWTDPYNLGDETYSFENYGDSDAQGGHCFGMSITSAGYYNGLLDISIIGGNANSSLYSFGKTQRVTDPICYYHARQGKCRDDAMVAGGSYYKNRICDIDSDWTEVVNYVKNHSYDGTGLLQIALRKNAHSGHAVNFLRYENVNGQDRIYAYDNNFPNQETYFYKDSNGDVRQAPVQTYSGALVSIALRDIRIYFDLAGQFDFSHALYMDNDAAEVQGYQCSHMEGGLIGQDYVLYELPEDTTQVTIVPKKDYADIIYMGTEYSFGAVSDKTYGVLVLPSNDEAAMEDGAGFYIYHSAGWHKIDGKWFYYDEDNNPIVGWKKIGSSWYYMDNSGIMQTGWQKISGKWYYFSGSGAMLTGWQKISEKWYYFNSSGAMLTGWQKISEKWYYFNSSGAMLTGWQTISKKTYYFKPSGAMAANEWCNGWWLNADGTWTYKYKGSWHQNAKGWWFGDESGWYAKNTTITINDKKYSFDANGYMK